MARPKLTKVLSDSLTREGTAQETAERVEGASPLRLFVPLHQSRWWKPELWNTTLCCWTQRSRRKCHSDKAGGLLDSWRPLVGNKDQRRLQKTRAKVMPGAVSKSYFYRRHWRGSVTIFNSLQRYVWLIAWRCEWEFLERNYDYKS